MYADDIDVFSRTAEELKLLLRVCADHAASNRYRFSVNKCAVIGDANTKYYRGNEVVPHMQQFT
jgi:hypothetical protein